MGIFSNIGCFEINIFVRERLDFKTLNMASEAPIKRLKTVCGLNPNPEHTKADPFLFVHNDRLFLFYETDGYKLGRGVISMISTSDLRQWTRPQVVLHEPFHLSYPFIFENDGVVYMMPESGAGGQIRLYRATNDNLTQFEPAQDLLKGRYLDSVLLQHGGAYYLFTSDEPEFRQYVLHLFCSDTLWGPYTEHPMSPICTDTEYSRSGGRIIEFDGHLCRIAQDCSRDYGENVSLITIDRLTPTEYEESIYCRNVFDRTREPFRGGGHHLTYVKYKGKYVIATDCKTTHLGLRNIYSFVRRFMRNY